MRSMSRGQTTPMPHVTAHERMPSARDSRRAAVSFLESVSPGRAYSCGRMTAAATTGPARQPRPASSMPANTGGRSATGARRWGRGGMATFRGGCPGGVGSVSASNASCASCPSMGVRCCNIRKALGASRAMGMAWPAGTHRCRGRYRTRHSAKASRRSQKACTGHWTARGCTLDRSHPTTP